MSRTLALALAVLAMSACSGGDPPSQPTGETAGSGGGGGTPALPDGGNAGGGGAAGAGGALVAPLPLCINEIMPDNAASITDETGATPDWIELHNPGAEDIALDGWSLTNDANDPAKSVLTGGLSLPAGGFLVLWADKLASSGPRHLTFNLDADGGVVGIYAPDGRGSVITFDAIDADFAAARKPDCCKGEGCFAYDFRGSPGESNVEPETVTALPPGSVYRYLDTGVAPPATWATAGFDDSTWSSGPAPLGYGDTHIVTNVKFGPDPSNKHVTTWFRATFAIKDAKALVAARLEILRDDGARAFLNGTEVARSNLPAGDLAPSTPATTAVGGAEETSFVGFKVDPALFVEGTNVLAIEVRQASVDSSDIGVDAAIRVDRPAQQ